MDRTKRESVTSILGLGFDNNDGHFRLTEGENFEIHNGSELSHQRMQTLCLLINEELDRRQLKLSDLTKAQFLELLDEIDVDSIE